MECYELDGESAAYSTLERHSVKHPRVARLDPQRMDLLVYRIDLKHDCKTIDLGGGGSPEVDLAEVVSSSLRFDEAWNI